MGTDLALNCKNNYVRLLHHVCLIVLILFGLIAVIASGGGGGDDGDSNTDDGIENSDNYDNPDTSDGTYSGGTISIQSDDEFTAANGVVGGSGTESDPYVIEGWTIDAFSSDLNAWPYIKVGIAISSTTKYFVIDDCEVENADVYGSGIALTFLSNGTVQNCILTADYNGISLDGCSNVVISYNNIQNCTNGVTTGSCSSDGIMISNNTVTSCTGIGIKFHYLTNSSATYNDVSSNSEGIAISSILSGGCSISNNTVQGNIYDGLFTDDDSQNLTISGNNTSDNGGIGLSVYGSYNTVSNNISSGNGYTGIKCDYTALAGTAAIYNIITDNTASNNGMDGIYIGIGCTNNRIVQNFCYNNNQQGVPDYYDISINATPYTQFDNFYYTIKLP
ncbi:MAG: right-handed parallel beta-helix repeat-containing protein [Deltaproteobacteria bacterium]|nr:right-handed parallel beta-helix repeat-containing protein [Deltaproteobacteria bacterium]